MSNNRDTQFLSFAKNLNDEIIQAGIDGIYDENPELYCQRLIAQRAYDLACHIVEHIDEDIAWRMDKGYTASQIVENDVPDMTELPENA